MSDTSDEKKNEVRFSQEQYDLLMKCSEMGDMSEWNEWRRRSRIDSVKLEKSNLERAFLNNAQLYHASLQDSCCEGVILQDANLSNACLQGSCLRSGKLQRSCLVQANLKGASLQLAELERAFLQEANLEDTDLSFADLRTATFRFAKVNGNTLLKQCRVDDETDFTGVGLASARIDPGLRERLEGNIRKKRWRAWCRAHWYNRPVELFWMLSDYGRSTGRLIGWFAAFAFLFALVYWTWGCCDLARGAKPADAGIISKLFVVDKDEVLAGLALVRSVYFSVVTMTTLGFGDMHANPGSYWGHILLSLQVLIGYVLLAALVTRLAVLFTGSGPESG